ncbi:MAG TPA: sigma-70 family RNA polymerase sigma factor [Pyrinomonadaceae bacterium]|jgi:RNA polymerase sigma-70 factor (ECF subfamily)|nr:sigma-70 family RNA polymerase sigma factor [Pyrinomonadaceae bacterium]
MVVNHRKKHLLHVVKTEQVAESEGPDPETEQVIKAQAQLVNEAIEKLPIEFREVVVLRELEELSYKEIAVVVGVPIGTVMSRLARARKRLLTLLEQERLPRSNQAARHDSLDQAEQLECLS